MPQMKGRKRVKGLVSVLILVSLVLASSCSGHDKSIETLKPAPVPADKVTVRVSSFDPPNALVTIGTAVTWTNHENITYLIADNNQRFSFTLPAGGSFRVTFTDPGTYDYHCSGHPDMQGKITVVPGAAVNADKSGKPGLNSPFKQLRGNG